MNWIVLLALAAVLIAIPALTGLKPAEGRPVTNTRLMGAARVILIVTAIGLAIFALMGYL